MKEIMFMGIVVILLLFYSLSPTIVSFEGGAEPMVLKVEGTKDVLFPH